MANDYRIIPGMTISILTFTVSFSWVSSLGSIRGNATNRRRGDAADGDMDAPQLARRPVSARRNSKHVMQSKNLDSNV